jgi:hypothetical protein
MSVMATPRRLDMPLEDAMRTQRATPRAMRAVDWAADHYAEAPVIV